MRILVLSRSASLYSTSRLVRSGLAREHEVDVVDPFELELVVAPRTAGLRYGGEALAGYHAAIPRIGASSTSYALAVLRELQDAGCAVLNRADAIALARDKVRSLRCLARQRVRVPRTVSLRNLRGLDAALALVDAYPVVVKLQSGTQGVGTMIAESARAAAALVETLGAMGQEIIVQEYIAEAKGSDLRAFVVGGRVVAAMRRTSRPDDFRANLHRGGQAEAVKLKQSYVHAALRAAATLGLDVCGVDMLETRRGPVVLEVNSSPGLEGIEQANAKDVAAAIIEHAERIAPAKAARPT